MMDTDENHQLTEQQHQWQQQHDNLKLKLLDDVHYEKEPEDHEEEKEGEVTSKTHSPPKQTIIIISPWTGMEVEVETTMEDELSTFTSQVLNAAVIEPTNLEQQPSLLSNLTISKSPSPTRPPSPKVQLLPLQLGTPHVIRMPTETSLLELGLAANSSHFATRTPRLGEFLHQHFEEIVVNGEESAIRMVKASVKAATSTLTTSSSDHQTIHYRDPYFDYWEQLKTSVVSSSMLSEDDKVITEEEKEMMQQIYDDLDTTHRMLRRQALAKERAKLNAVESDGGDNNSSTAKKNANSGAGGSGKKRTPTSTTKRVTKRTGGKQTSTKTPTKEEDTKPIDTTTEVRSKDEPEVEKAELPEKSPTKVSTKSSPTKKSTPRGVKRKKVVEPAKVVTPKKSIRISNRNSIAKSNSSSKTPEISMKEETDADNLELDLHIQVKQEFESEEEEDPSTTPLTADQRRKKLARERKRAQTERILRAETPAEREQRLIKQRERQRRFYAKETPEQRARRLDKVRLYQLARKAKMGTTSSLAINGEVIKREFNSSLSD